MAQDAEAELVGFGGGNDRPPRAPLVQRLRRHPVLVVLVAVAVVATVAVSVVVRRASAPELPTVVATDAEPATEPGTLRKPYPWQAALDARPDGPVVLRRSSDLVFPPHEGTIEVYGLGGPGIDVPDRPARRLDESTRSTALTFETVVDCEEVPLPVPADAYGVLVRVIDGGRTTRGVIPAGAVGREWGSAIDVACSSWLARTHVSVSAASVDFDDDRPRALVAMTLANSGDTDAFVRAGAGAGDGDDDLVVTTAPAGTVRVPAGGSTAVTADVRIDRCDTVASIQTVGNGTGVPRAVTSDVVDLYAMSGSAGVLIGPTPTWTTGLGPTGVLFSQSAAEALSAGLLAACGGVEGFAVLVDPDRTSFDDASGVLSVRLLVDTPLGRVRDVSLITSGADGPKGLFVPLTSRTARLVPDRTGQVRTTMRYRASAAVRCPTPQLFLPGFDIVARAPGSSGLRTVRFSQYSVVWEDEEVRRVICPGRD